jgi:hypothetical protein
MDSNVGDPIWPAPQEVRLPRLLEGELVIRGYPLKMVLAEKIVTALARGTLNTRWRDFVDIYVLVRRHAVNAHVLRESTQRVAQYRGINVPLGRTHAGYPVLAQSRRVAWLRKQRLEGVVPAEFSSVLVSDQVSPTLVTPPCCPLRLTTYDLGLTRNLPGDFYGVA